MAVAIGVLILFGVWLGLHTALPWALDRLADFVDRPRTRR
jgi:hypothetical protein